MRLRLPFLAAFRIGEIDAACRVRRCAAGRDLDPCLRRGDGGRGHTGILQACGRMRKRRFSTSAQAGIQQACGRMPRTVWCNPMPSWSSAIPGRRRRRLKHVPVLRPLLLLRLHSPQIRGKTALHTQIRSDASCGVYGRSAIRVVPIFHGYNSAQNRAFWGLAGPETPHIAPDCFNNCFVCKDIIH